MNKLKWSSHPWTYSFLYIYIFEFIYLWRAKKQGSCVHTAGQNYSAATVHSAPIPYFSMYACINCCRCYLECGTGVGGHWRVLGEGIGRRWPHRLSPTNAAWIKYGSSTRKQFPPRLASPRFLADAEKPASVSRLKQLHVSSPLPSNGWCMHDWLLTASASECGRSLEKVSQEEMWIPSGIRWELAAFHRQQVHREDSGRLYTPSPSPTGPNPTSALGKWG